MMLGDSYVVPIQIDAFSQYRFGCPVFGWVGFLEKYGIEKHPPQRKNYGDKTPPANPYSTPKSQDDDRQDRVPCPDTPRIGMLHPIFISEIKELGDLPFKCHGWLEGVKCSVVFYKWV